MVESLPRAWVNANCFIAVRYSLFGVVHVDVGTATVAKRDAILLIEIDSYRAIGKRFVICILAGKGTAAPAVGLVKLRIKPDRFGIIPYCGVIIIFGIVRISATDKGFRRAWVDAYCFAIVDDSSVVEFLRKKHSATVIVSRSITWIELDSLVVVSICEA